MRFASEEAEPAEPLVIWKLDERCLIYRIYAVTSPISCQSTEPWRKSTFHDFMNIKSPYFFIFITEVALFKRAMLSDLSVPHLQLHRCRVCNCWSSNQNSTVHSSNWKHSFSCLAHFGKPKRKPLVTNDLMVNNDFNNNEYNTIFQWWIMMNRIAIYGSSIAITNH